VSGVCPGVFLKESVRLLSWLKNESPEGFAFVQIEPVIPVPSRRSR